jgi:methylenetetrahydrofolate dehydrogenase (NADP+) / methenyltetrahydrofolate cyclohydrolase
MTTMTARIDGKAIAQRVRARLAEEVASAFGGSARTPGLATILVGDDPASAVYVASKRRAVSQAGLRDLHRALPEQATQDDVAAVIDQLAADPEVSDILLQLPLPKGLDSAALIDRIPVGKDVDGLTTQSAGLLARGEYGLRPCTPSGVIELLDAESVAIPGAHAVVVGRSELVGRPMAQLLCSVMRRSPSLTPRRRTWRPSPGWPTSSSPPPSAYAVSSARSTSSPAPPSSTSVSTGPLPASPATCG